MSRRPSLGSVEGELDAAACQSGCRLSVGDDGSYDLRLNQFLRELPTMGVRDEKSWLAYARDLLTCSPCFLTEQRGKTVWEAERTDIAAYHHARRLGPPETSISLSTWDRGIVALDKFYRWATTHGHVERPPFSYRAPRSSAFLPRLPPARAVTWPRSAGAGAGRRDSCRSRTTHLP